MNSLERGTAASLVKSDKLINTVRYLANTAR